MKLPATSFSHPPQPKPEPMVEPPRHHESTPPGLSLTVNQNQGNKHKSLMLEWRSYVVGTCHGMSADVPPFAWLLATCHGMSLLRCVPVRVSTKRLCLRRWGEGDTKKIREICLVQKSRIQKKVSEMRFELTQPNGHYPLKVACLPIPPPGHLWVKMNKLVSF